MSTSSPLNFTSHSVTDFGIETFSYTTYCKHLAASLAHEDPVNPVIDLIGEPFWDNVYERKYVSPFAIHEALIDINPELYLFNDRIEFTSYTYIDAIKSYIYKMLRKNIEYNKELAAYEIKGMATFALG